MKPHPRIRKTIKWGGAALTVLLVVVWIGSGWCEGRWIVTNRGSLGMLFGRLHVYGPNRLIDFPTDWPASSWPRGPLGPRFRLVLIPAFSLSRREAIIPMWIPPFASLAACGYAWHRDALARRRAGGRLNLCPKCNYDRAGLGAGAVCPECGTPSA
jgi:hypothetical protein